MITAPSHGFQVVRQSRLKRVFPKCPNVFPKPELIFECPTCASLGASCGALPVVLLLGRGYLVRAGLRVRPGLRVLNIVTPL